MPSSRKFFGTDGRSAIITGHCYRSVRSAGRIYGSCSCILMPGGRNFRICVHIAATGACVGGVTSCVAGGSSHDGFVAMTQCFSLGGSADGAGFCDSTGCILPCMTKSCNFLRLLMCTEAASKGSNARCGAAGIGCDIALVIAVRTAHAADFASMLFGIIFCMLTFLVTHRADAVLSIPLVSQGGNGFLSDGRGATDGTFLALSQSAFSTRGIVSGQNFLCVPQRRNFCRCTNGISTDRALCACRRACLGAGCVHCGNYFLGVTQCLHGFGIAVTTSAASKGFCTCSGAGRFGSNHTFIILMSQSRNLILSEDNLTADAAFLALGQAGGATGRGHGSNNFLGVGKFSDGLSPGSATDRAGIQHAAFLTAGSGYSRFTLVPAVAQSINHILGDQSSIAAVAVLTFSQTGGSTGCGNRFIYDFVMSQSIYDFLCRENFATNRAVAAFSQTGSGAGGRYSRIHNRGVTQSGNLSLGNQNLSTYRAMLAFC